MLNLNMFLGASMPDWLSVAVPIIKIALVVLIAISAIAIILIVLSMDTTGEGAAANSITGRQGVQDSFLRKNMSSSKEGRLKTLMIICSSLVAGLTIVYFVFTAIINNLFS